MLEQAQKKPSEPKLKACVIINTYSRKGEKLFFEALDGLQAHGISIVASYPVRNPEKLPEIIKEAISRPCDIVIVGGGDGTISSIVDNFAHKDIVLGLLPLGTGNSFVRTLGIPLSLHGAIDVIVRGKIAKVDLGKINGDYFANVISIGFAADVARRTSRKLKRRLGPLAYGIVGIKLFFTTKKFQADLEVDGVKHVVLTHQIIVANGSIYGITPLAGEADVDSGKLLVLTMDMMNRWLHLLFWLRFFTGWRGRVGTAKYFQGSDIRLDTHPVKPVDIDGDTLAKTPARISVASKALRIMVPKSFHEH